MAAKQPGMTTDTKKDNSMQDDSMQIFVRNIAGWTITINDLKSKIQSKHGIPPDQQRLMLGHNPLDDKVTVADFLPATDLHLVLRMSWAMPVVPQACEQSAPLRHVQPPHPGRHPGPNRPFNCGTVGSG